MPRNLFVLNCFWVSSDLVKFLLDSLPENLIHDLSIGPLGKIERQNPSLGVIRHD